MTERGELLHTVPAPPVPVLDSGWSARVVDPDGADLDLVQEWMSRPHVARFWQQAWSRRRWHQELSDQLAGAHSRPCLVSRDGELIMYVEVYRAARDRIAQYYPALPHDLGLHLAIGDTAATGQGHTGRLLPRLTAALFAADPRCRRVLLEPDVRNVAAVRAFTTGGFRMVGRLTLPEKTAALLVSPRCEEDLP